MYLQDKKDKVFDGIISGVKDYGIFVELTDSKCEGMVRIKNLIDDFYEFDEDNHCLVGRRTKRKFQLGDTLQVIIEQTDLQKRQIDFVLFEDGKKQTGGSYERGSSGVKNKKSKERAKKNTDFRKKQGGKKNKGKKRRR